MFGAQRHGYFEASPNHDAIAFRVADAEQAGKIFRKMVSIPQLRPHDFILPNYPSYDDMYEKPEGLWGYGTWVNGGHWSTCEARMILAYYRMSDHESARRSMVHLLDFAARFRMDNPLTKCGSDVYQPNQPINLCYDTLGPPAAFMRGLFEYLYRADGLTLLPHIPPGITELHQSDPVRLGPKRLYLSTYGRGPVTAVKVNGRNWKEFTTNSVSLPFAEMPETAQIQIALGGAKLSKLKPQDSPKPKTQLEISALDLKDPRPATLRAFLQRLKPAKLDQTTEAAHARLALQCFEVASERKARLQSGSLKPLPEPAQTAAAKSYEETATKIYDGLAGLLKTYERSADRTRARLNQLWNPS